MDDPLKVSWKFFLKSQLKQQQKQKIQRLHKLCLVKSVFMVHR